MVSFKCKDLGTECTYEVTAKTIEELKEKVKVHVAKVHQKKAAWVNGNWHLY